MKREEAIAIIDALAAGCSPFTGEVLEDHPILNDRNVIRALQTALVALSSHPGLGSQVIQVPERGTADVLTKEQVIEAINLLKEANIRTSHSKLTWFFLGSTTLKDTPVAQSPLYGLLKDKHQYKSLKPVLWQLLKDHPDVKALAALDKAPPEEKPWASVDYFTRPTFCKLSAKAIDQLKAKIDTLGLQKPTDTLSENIKHVRLLYPRAYEPWIEPETEYLSKILFYTNDLKVLSSCFQRTESSLSSIGKKLIYEGKAAIAPLS